MRKGVIGWLVKLLEFLEWLGVVKVIPREWWGYRDTIERIGSADSLRCGHCYRKYAKL